MSTTVLGVLPLVFAWMEDWSLVRWICFLSYTCWVAPVLMLSFVDSVPNGGERLFNISLWLRKTSSTVRSWHHLVR